MPPLPSRTQPGTPSEPTSDAPAERGRGRRTAAGAAAALALTLAVAPFLPSDDDSGPDGLAPAGDAPPIAASAAPGLGELTPAMQREIDRVVAAGRDLGAVDGRSAVARELARCATFAGQRYCLGVGWTTQDEAQVAARLAAPAPRTGQERTGDLGPAAILARAARMSPRERAATERAELTMAARSVAKVWQIRHEIQGVPLPEKFRVGSRAVVSGRPAATAYPTDKYQILNGRRTLAQNEYYWCGPAAMQAIAWGSQGKRMNQAFWARRLRTSTAGTAITDMVRVVNRHTDYDDEAHAGPYVALDVADFSFDEWYLLMMRHVHDYQAPVVLHPVLLKRYFPYLDDDASGHFQVGRGFDQNPDGNPRLGYFEPWDQSRFDPSEPHIPRVQWRNAYRSYRANQDHFQHNVGV